MSAVVKLSDITNGAKEQIQSSEPWTCRVEITGSADLLFHRWNNEARRGGARRGAAGPGWVRYGKAWYGKVHFRGIR